MFFNCWFTRCTIWRSVELTIRSRFFVELWVLLEWCFWPLPQQMRLSVFATANSARAPCFRFRRFLLQLRPKAHTHLVQRRRNVLLCFVLTIEVGGCEVLATQHCMVAFMGTCPIWGHCMNLGQM